MLPLTADALPNTSATLAQAIASGLQSVGVAPRTVTADGAAWPALTSLIVDLSGANLTRELRSQAGSSGEGETITVADFQLSGDPLLFEKTPFVVAIKAQGATAQIAGAPANARLSLVSAESGNVSLQVAESALEALVHSIIVEAAKKQGFEVRQTRLTFTQDNLRSVAFKCEVTAKVFVMSATLALNGHLGIDDELNARFSGLTLGGDAMITKLAAGFVRPHLDRLEGRTFPLLAYTAAGLKLHDIELHAGPTLEVRARFGAA